MKSSKREDLLKAIPSRDVFDHGQITRRVRKFSFSDSEKGASGVWVAGHGVYDHTHKFLNMAAPSCSTRTASLLRRGSRQSLLGALETETSICNRTVAGSEQKCCPPRSCSVCQQSLRALSCGGRPGQPRVRSLLNARSLLYALV